MTQKKTPYDGMDFRLLAEKLYKDTNGIAEEVYAATQDPPGKEEMTELINRGQQQIGYYETLLGRHTAGKRDAIAEVDRNVELLKGFLLDLIKLQKTAK